jgi:CheY-like chemotaxis protein
VEADLYLRHLHDALSNLDDLPFRTAHPITAFIGAERDVASAHARQLILDGIERLKPGTSLPPDAPRWRRYRYLTLRYVEGARPEEVRAVLGVSARQARREHHAALVALATLLRESVPALRPDDAVSAELEAGLAEVDAATSAAPTDLAGAVDDAVRLVTRLASERGVDVLRAFSGPAPYVAASPEVLRQTLLILLGHLIQIAPGGRVLVTAAEQVGSAELTFETGVVSAGAHGVHPALTGPSVTAARRLIESQDGALRIGTTAAGGVLAGLTLPTDGATLVLVVDDNPDLVRLLRRFLRGEGFRLVQARNAFLALDAARALRPDVVVVDIMMPVQDGWDFHQQLRADPTIAATPTIACSILPERELALSLGFDAFLPKPISQDSLLAVLARYRRPPGRRPPRDGPTAAPPDSL